MQLVFIDNTACVYGIELIYTGNKKAVDLLDLPSQFNNLTFGTEANTLRLFNLIISDTTITKRVVDFINVLRKQVNFAADRCCPVTSNVQSINYYMLYVNLLQAYLVKTIEITAFNLSQKIDFITPYTQYPFMLFPYLSGTSTSTKSFLTYPLLASSFTTDNTARFIQ